MNDPHVVSLTYRIRGSKEVTYVDPPALTLQQRGFKASLEDGVLTLEPEDHFPSIESARDPAERFLRAWELDTSLRLGYGALTFEYVTAEVIDRDPPPPGSPIVLQVNSASQVHIAGHVTLHVTRRQYPEPPQYFQFTDDVAVLWNRFETYRQGQEPILGMAYFCLSWIERLAGGRRAAARLLNVDRPVLNKLGELTSERGDPTEARKAHGSTPVVLSEPERRWLEQAIKRLIRMVGEYQSHRPLPLRMRDLPRL